MKASYIVLICILLNSCRYNNGGVQTILLPDSKIEYLIDTIDIAPMEDSVNEMIYKHYFISPGDLYVACFTYAQSQNDQTRDDEYGYKFNFEIDTTKSSFYFHDDSLALIQCYFYEYGAWVRGNHHPVLNGFISGDKIDTDTWFIKWDMETTPIFIDEEPFPLSGTAYFEII